VNVRRESASPLRTGEVRQKTQGGERSSSSASSSPQAVWRSRDRGCNGHRILRRALTDGRHPGSSRGVSFHEGASTVVSAVFAPSDPRETFQKKDARPGCSVPERGRGVRVNRGSRQGCQRLGRIHAVGRKRPRSSRTAERQGSRSAFDDDPPKRTLGRRETSGPPVTPHGA